MLPVSIQHALAQAIDSLATSSVQDNPKLDAELLVAHVLNKKTSYLYAWPEVTLTGEQQRHFQQLLEKRRSGQPLAYLLGHWDFWSLTLTITPDVLVPRPETELLVASALALVSANQAIKVADLGTGSGAIALALAKERPDWQVWATDQSTTALQVAQANGQQLGLTHVHYQSGDWCGALSATDFNMIISNPPYIDASDPHLSQDGVAFEPYSALVAGEQGLANLRLIAQQAKHYLLPQGYLLLEHGYQQGQAVRHYLKQSGYRSIQTRQDLNGLDRVTLAQV
jgi:release factor glutamine methyltransferase